jgi:hypothetical protein
MRFDCNIKMNPTKWDRQYWWRVASGSESCSMVVFDINPVEPLGYTTTVLDGHHVIKSVSCCTQWGYITSVGTKSLNNWRISQSQYLLSVVFWVVTPRVVITFRRNVSPPPSGLNNQEDHNPPPWEPHISHSLHQPGTKRYKVTVFFSGVGTESLTL